MKISGHPSSHPLQGLEIVDASERARQQLAGELPRLSQLIRETLQSTHDNGLTLSGINAWLEYIAKQEELLSAYTDDVLSLKPRQLEGEWNAVQQKWFLPRFFARRSFTNRMRAYKADFNPEADVEALCQKLDDCQRLASTCGCDRQQVVGAATSKACRELDAKLTTRNWPCSTTV